MDEKILADHIDKLCRRQTTVHSILQCSPFDASRNLDKSITPEIFFKYLFVENISFQKLKDMLYGQLTNSLRNNQIIFLEGFSGTGKTTFIKYFVQSYPNFESIYIDFFPLAHRSSVDLSGLPSETVLEQTQKDLLRILNKAEGENAKVIETTVKQLQSINLKLEEMSEQKHPIGLVLKAHLSEQDQESLKNFLYFLKEKCRPLSRYFSSSFATKLRDFEPATEVNQLRTFLQTADLKDTFLLFFLYYANRYQRKSSFLEKTHLIIFDNLDTVKLAYLTRFFKETFVNAFVIFSEVSQDQSIFTETIHFNSKFKFLFCLRDANNTTINAHASDQLEYLSVPLYFPIGFDSNLYKLVMRKRLELFLLLQEKCPQTSESAIAKKVTDMLIAFSDNKFFTDILAPLLNFNFRKLTHLVFEALNDIVKIKPFRCGISFDNISPESYIESLADRYGVNGAIFFGITKSLRDSNFLNKYPFLQVISEPEEGYCLSTRMILSILLNKSNLEASRYVLDNLKPFEDIPLGEIIKFSQNIYEVGDIVGTLVEVFRLHEKSWVHLVTFRNKPVESKDAFKDDIDEIQSSGQIPDRLNEVLVTLNPSGFVFLKNLIVHFEFYSVFTKNPHSLFFLGLAKSDEGSGRYLFESCIENVQHLVLNHVRAMGKFYQNKFAQKGWSDEAYLASDFVFKHFKQGAPKKRGYFHSTRVISRHIAYLDKFRLWVLQKSDCKVEQSELIEVNQKLVTYIEKYLNMLIQWGPEPSEFTSYKEDISEKINLIKGKKYNDMKAHIAAREGEILP